MDRILSSAEHVKFCVNLPEPSGKAKYVVRPIANKYREGKVKSTPTRGVKQFLKLDAYNQSEPARVTAYLLYNGSST